MHSTRSLTAFLVVVWFDWGSCMQILNLHKSFISIDLTSIISYGNFISTWVWNSHIKVKYGRERVNIKMWKCLYWKIILTLYRWPSFIRFFYTIPRENSHIIVTCVYRRRWWLNIVYMNSNRHFQNGWNFFFW